MNIDVDTSNMLTHVNDETAKRLPSTCRNAMAYAMMKHEDGLCLQGIHAATVPWQRYDCQNHMG